MGSCRRLLNVIQLVASLGTAFKPQFTFAYDHPLSDRAVREAYFVGQDVKNVNKFLSQYVRALPVPQNGPHVADIELNTPYAQVVETSALHSVGYSDLQAAEDYRKRGDFIAVRVRILLTPTYTGRKADFWRDVSVGLIQGKNHIAAMSIDGRPIYSSADGGVLIGAEVFGKFSVVSVESDSLQVEVMPPEGPAARATFDLKNLR